MTTSHRGSWNSAKPHVNDHHPVSKRFNDLARHLDPIAIDYTERMGARPTDGLVRLLSLVERTGYRSSTRDGEGTDLATLVRAHKPTLRALFWSDVDAHMQRTKPPGSVPPSSHHVWVPGEQLWHFDETDLPWLEQDLRDAVPELRPLVLNIVISVLHMAERLKGRDLLKLRAQLKGQPNLLNLLVGALGDLELIKIKGAARERKTKARAATEKNKLGQAKQSWRNFFTQISSEPNALKDPKRLLEWSGFGDLENLTRWLAHKSRGSYPEAATQWALLKTAISVPVAEGYREGMKLLWRNTEPVPPAREAGHGITINIRTQLAFWGLPIESAERTDWADLLSSEEARKAAIFACDLEESFPGWIHALAERWSDITLPRIESVLWREWKSSDQAGRSFLFWYGENAAPPIITPLLWRVVSAWPPPSPEAAKLGIKILARLPLSEDDRQSVLDGARSRLASLDPNESAPVAREFARMIAVDPQIGVEEALAWLARKPKNIAQCLLGSLFGRHQTLVTRDLKELPLATIVKLLDASFRALGPMPVERGDRAHRGDAREEAEGARERAERWLFDTPGYDAYAAMRAVSRRAGLNDIARHYFKERARQMLEREADLIPWSTQQFVRFESDHVFFPRTGRDLLTAVVGMLDTIGAGLRQDDFSSQKLLRQAKKEEEVQHWLAERVHARACGSATVHREYQFANDNKPDFIVSASGAEADVQVAIELKIANSWTLAQLEWALTHQLAEDYLKPASRRNGVLVLLMQKQKVWVDTKRKRRLTFEALIAHLTAIANKKTSNAVGAISLRVCGLDVHSSIKDPPASKQRPSKARSTKTRAGDRKRGSKATPTRSRRKPDSAARRKRKT